MDDPAHRPKRGAPRKGDVSARDRIIATAADLFYRNGTNAVGVDTVVEASGVSKTSLYRLFRSKDELIAAVTREQDRDFWAWWDRIEARHANDPQACLEALLAGFGKRLNHPLFRGCPFLNLASEFPTAAHPARIEARTNKHEMHARIADILKRMGTQDPDRIAGQISMLINGALVLALTVGPSDLAQDLAAAGLQLTKTA